jgi:hypothetical protein
MSHIKISPVDLWARLKTRQSSQGAVQVSNQMPPNYKLTPNSSYLLGTELRVIPTSAFIGNSKTSWTVLRRMSPVIFKMVNLQRRTHFALCELMSARTTGTTVICLGDMCWLIRQFDIKPWRFWETSPCKNGITAVSQHVLARVKVSTKLLSWLMTEWEKVYEWWNKT